MWILILTMYSFTSGYQPAVASIPNFKDKQKCLDAGQTWLKQQSNTRSSGEVRALCVPS